MEESRKLECWINGIATMAISGICFGYIYGYSHFAERNIRVPCLNFPIFIGEIVIFLCLFLMLVKFVYKRTKINKWHFMILGYAGFVLVKGFYGYGQWGSLAFRHAALFYYPIFTLFTYYFFDRALIKKFSYVFIGIILFFFVTKHFYIYYLLTCLIAALLLIHHLPHGIIKYVLGGVMLVTTPYMYFFNTARMMILAHLVFGIYLIVIGFGLLKISIFKKMSFAFVCIIMLLGVATISTRASTFNSIFDFKELKKSFDSFDQEVQAKKGTFKFKKRSKVALYNPNFGDVEFNDSIFSLKQEDMGGDLESTTVQVTRQPLSEEQEQKRIKEVEVNNAVFRLLIWRDMFEEYAEKMPVLGFSFGWPLRSKSLEILGWAHTEWSRDGWIAPHNSFFHMVYRCGILGVLFILIIIYSLFRMIWQFVRLRSLDGILLCGVLLSWFVAANFLVILELPYTAIPIWSLFGVTIACCRLQMDKHNHSSEA